MTTAAQCTFALGTLLLCLYAWMLLHPVTFRAALSRYPRSRIPGLLLSFLALSGFAWNLWGVDFGGLSILKRLLIPAVPLGWYLITRYLPDLLSVRSLAAVLLLAGNPLLVHTRWQGTPASLLFGVLVYLLVVKSIFLVAYPHLWLRALQWSFQNPRRAKTLGGLGVGFSLFMLGIAWISR